MLSTWHMDLAQVEVTGSLSKLCRLKTRQSSLTLCHGTHDSKGFFYSRCPAPKESENLDAGTETNANLNHEVYYHFLGTNQSEDILCWRDPDNSKHTFGTCVTDDGKVRKRPLNIKELAKNEEDIITIEPHSNSLTVHETKLKIGPFQVSDREKVKVKVQLNLHGIVTVESASLIEDHRDDSRVNARGTSEKMETDNDTSSDVAEVDITHARWACLQGNFLMLLNTYRSFATKFEKEGISRNLQQTEDWLYDDGVDESENIYSEKLDDLKKLVDPVENQYKDEDARAQATRGLLNCIVDYRMAVGSLPPSERDAVVNECNKAEQWLQEKTQRQDSLPKNADPILWPSEIKRKADALDAMCKHIMRSKASGTRPEDTMDAEQRNKQDDMRVD